MCGKESYGRQLIEDLKATGKWGKRYVTWAELSEEGSGARFWHFNTHWQLGGKQGTGMDKTYFFIRRSGESVKVRWLSRFSRLAASSFGCVLAIFKELDQHGAQISSHSSKLTVAFGFNGESTPALRISSCRNPKERNSFESATALCHLGGRFASISLGVFTAVRSTPVMRRFASKAPNAWCRSSKRWG